MLDLDKIRCNPPGSIGTALGIELDRPGERRCGMCQRDVSASRLNDICQHCGHRFDWFQLLTMVSAIGNSPRSERALAAYIKRRQKKQAEREQFEDGAWGDPGSEYDSSLDGIYS